MLRIKAAQLIEAVGGSLISGDVDKYGSVVINRASYDSRDVDANTVFVPIIGENVNPHKFIPKMLDETECVVSFTQQDDFNYNGDKLLIKVNDSTNAVQRLAEICRNEIHVPVIGITGSVGKTTTRQFITLALSAGKKVYATPGNKNSQIGTPQTIFDFDDDAEIAVLEMGMSMPGEMTRLAKMVKPDTVVFTNIGITHIENLGSRENILSEKSHILDYAKDGTDVFLNADNDLLSCAEFKPEFNKIYYGLNNKKDIYAENLDLSEGYPSFVACIKGKRINVKLHVYGKHQVYNALVALAVADSYGIDLNEAAKKMTEYKGFAHRNQIYKHQGITIIDDTYNAAPDSMKAALDMLSVMRCEGRRIAVLADMKELGELSESAHYDVGRYAKAKGNINAVITYGELAKGITKGFGGTECHHFEDAKVLENGLYESLKSGDTVLFKGSNSMKLFDFVDKVMNHEFM